MDAHISGPLPYSNSGTRKCKLSASPKKQKGKKMSGERMAVYQVSLQVLTLLEEIHHQLLRLVSRHGFKGIRGLQEQRPHRKFFVCAIHLQIQNCNRKIGKFLSGWTFVGPQHCFPLFQLRPRRIRCCRTPIKVGVILGPFFRIISGYRYRLRKKKNENWGKNNIDAAAAMAMAGYLTLPSFTS